MAGPAASITIPAANNPAAAAASRDLIMGVLPRVQPWRGIDDYTRQIPTPAAGVTHGPGFRQGLTRRVFRERVTHTPLGVDLHGGGHGADRLSTTSQTIPVLRPWRNSSAGLCLSMCPIKKL